jgi:transcription initiation factor TFIIIB Brf1 subunit/transcription initiation factor TFIIB
MSCKLNNVPRSIKEICDAFGIPTKDLTRTTYLFQDALKDKDPAATSTSSTTTVTQPRDILPRILNEFDIDFELKKKIRIKCTRLAQKIESCVELMGKTPSSIASVIILMSVDGLFTKKEICEKCKISVPTMNKIEILVKNFLKTEL